jgi:hypothetical protein
MATRTALGGFDDDARKLIKIAGAIASVAAGAKALMWLIDKFLD